MMSSDIERYVKHFGVSRETLSMLQAYGNLLEQWNRKINLVSRSTLETLWTRHFLDSAQILDLVRPAGRWVDLGSGAGFPGMVIAIHSAEIEDLEIILVEADQRKAAFLRAVARELALKVRVIADRIEHIEPLRANFLSARALAPLTDLLGFASTHMKPSGTAIFPKGRKADDEIAVALERWRFDCEKHRSLTDENSTILCIGDIKRV